MSWKRITTGIYLDEYSRNINKYKVVYRGRTIGRYYTEDEARDARKSHIDIQDQLDIMIDMRNLAINTYIVAINDHHYITTAFNKKHLRNKMRTIIPLDFDVSWEFVGDFTKIFRFVLNSSARDAKNWYKLSNIDKKEINRLFLKYELTDQST